MLNRNLGLWRVAAMSALGAFLILPTVAAAAPAGRSGQAVTSFARITTPLHSAHFVSSAHLTGMVHFVRPEAVAHAPSADISSGQQLQIPLPSNAQNVAQGTITPTDADNTNTNLFTSLDDQTYTASGVVGGFEEVANVPLGTTTDTALVEWLGTYYGTDAQALAKLNETVKFLNSKNIQNVSCGTNCYAYALSVTDPTTNKSTTILYTTFTSQNAVGELAVVVPTDTLTTDQSDVTTLLGTLAAAGFKAVGGQQQQAGVSIIDFELGHMVKKTLKATHTLKSGEKGYLVVLVQDSNQDTSNLQATATITSGGKTVHTVTLQSQGAQSDGSILLAGTFKIKTTKTRKYVANALAQDGSVQGTATLKFTVKKK